MIKCIIIAEDECDGHIFEFASLAEANAFAEGVSEGAGLYGAGGCAAYNVHDLDTLDPEEDANIIRYIEEYLA